jgi:hypothetical protein
MQTECSADLFGFARVEGPMPRWRSNGPHRVPKPHARSPASAMAMAAGINAAPDAMTRTAHATRDRAAVLDMKAKTLSGAKTAEEDPNIAAAMAAAAGTAANAKVADRLVAVQQRK